MESDLGYFQTYEVKQIFQNHISTRLTLLSVLNLCKTCKWFNISLQKHKKLERKDLFSKLSKSKFFWRYLGKWGETDLIDLFLSKTENNEKFHWCFLAWGLASSGHQKIFMQYFDKRIDENLLLKGALYGAACYGDSSFIEKLLSSVHQINEQQLKYQILFGFIKKGNLDMVKYWIDKVKNVPEFVFNVAGESGNKDMIKFFQTLPNIEISDYKKEKCIFAGYCAGGHLDLVEETLRNLLKYTHDNFSECITTAFRFAQKGISEAALYRRPELVDYFLNSTYFKMSPKTFSRKGYIGALESGDRSLIQKFQKICLIHNVDVSSSFEAFQRIRNPLTSQQANLVNYLLL